MCFSAVKAVNATEKRLQKIQPKNPSRAESEIQSADVAGVEASQHALFEKQTFSRKNENFFSSQFCTSLSSNNLGDKVAQCPPFESPLPKGPSRTITTTENIFGTGKKVRYADKKMLQRLLSDYRQTLLRANNFRDGEETIKIQFTLLGDGGIGESEENRSKTLFFFFFSWGMPRQYNVESANFSVEKFCCHCTGSYNSNCRYRILLPEELFTMTETDL